MTNSNLDKTIIEIDNEGVNYLTETTKWAKFLSIVGFVFIGIMFIFIFVIAISAGFLPTTRFNFVSVLPLTIICIIYFFPVLYLFQFSRYSKLAISNKDSGLVSKALKFLKMHYKFMGILLIVVIIIYLIVGTGLLLSGRFFKMI